MKKTLSTLVEVSGRHLHLSAKDLAILFGRKYRLKILKKISQPNQYACQKTLKVVGPKDSFPKIRVVGPPRSLTQLEISVTDAYKLGLMPKLRMSGDLKGTSGGVTLVGPRGRVQLNKGLIIAQRHLHIEPELAKKYGLRHRSLVSVRISGKRGLIFDRVVVRSRPGIDHLSFQIDTDEANAAGVRQGSRGWVICRSK